MIQNLLAIETSCDDTSVAVVNAKAEVLSLVSASQDLVHAEFGGIVPEIACRNHSLALVPLIQEAMAQAQVSWKDLQGLAVTNRPGLIGSLIVGLVTAKSLAQAHGLPLIGVNHLEGHIWAPFLRDQTYAPKPSFTTPFLALAVSGGHSSLYEVKGLGDYLVLGATKDDAAGEAFDKFAKMVGLGFPGGARVDREAKAGRADAYEFPRSLIHEENYDFSFSGVKSAARRLLESMSEDEILQRRPDLCASYQEAVIDALLAKLDRAVRLRGQRRVVITGGVSANSRLRAKAEAWALQRKVELMIPPLRFCTDNAAMIGLVGLRRLERGERHDLQLGPSPQSSPGDFQWARS